MTDRVQMYKTIRGEKLERYLGRTKPVQIRMRNEAIKGCARAIALLDMRAKSRHGVDDDLAHRVTFDVSHGNVDWYVSMEVEGGSAAAVEYGRKAEIRQTKTGQTIHITKTEGLRPLRDAMGLP